MQRSARISAVPDVEFRYWTVDASSQSEAEAWLESKEEPASMKQSRKLDRYILEMKLAENARKKAEEERRLEAEQWKGLHNAMDEVEEEIEVEHTAAAMGGVAISQKLPWEEDLVDRTKD